MATSDPLIPIPLKPGESPAGPVCEVCGRPVMRVYPKCYGPNDVECYRLGHARLRARLVEVERELADWRVEFCVATGSTGANSMRPVDQHAVVAELIQRAQSAALARALRAEAALDRRGEEERAKALAEMADRVEQARDDGASMARSNLNAARAEADGLRARVSALEKLLGEAAVELESEAQNYEDEARFGRRQYQPHGKSLLAVATRARKLLAAAPSGDATTYVCVKCGSAGDCVPPCDGKMVPAGDAPHQPTVRGWFCPDCPMVIRTAIGEKCPQCGADLLTPAEWRKMLNDLLGAVRQRDRIGKFGREAGLRADLAEKRPEFTTTAEVWRFDTQQRIQILGAPSGDAKGTRDG